MNSTMGIITNTMNEDLLQDINQRCMAAVPFGGRYRLIDFVLSNMVNAGIRNVGVVTSQKHRTLIDHLGAGKDWGLDRKTDGLFILPSVVGSNIFYKKVKINLNDLYENIDYLHKSKQQYVIISGTNMVCNIDYQEVLNFHKEKQADVTIIYKEKEANFRNLTYLEIDSNKKVKNLSLHPSKDTTCFSLDMMIIKKNLLLDIINVSNMTGNWDLENILVDNLDKLNVYGYSHQGYLAIIDSIENYYKYNLELLNPDVWYELFLKSGPIYTKAKNGPPAKYSDSSEVNNSLVATGCDIKGKVENSIVFRGVTIKDNAYVKNSIIMPKSIIEEGVILENVILNKEVTVRKGESFKGDEKHPIVIGKKTFI